MYNIGDYLCVDDFNGNIYPYKVVAAIDYDDIGSTLYYLQDIIKPELNVNIVETLNVAIVKSFISGNSAMQPKQVKHARVIFETDDCIIPKEAISIKEIEDIIETEKLR